MNGFKKFMDGMYKIIAPWIEVLFALFITIAANYGIQSYKAWMVFSGSLATVLIIVFQVFFWLFAVLFIASKVLNAVHITTSDPNALNALKSVFSAPQSNTYAQPQQNYAQPQQNYAQPQQNVAAPVAPVENAGADKFCTQCGARVPAGTGFCTGCGAKMD